MQNTNFISPLTSICMFANVGFFNLKKSVVNKFHSLVITLIELGEREKCAFSTPVPPLLLTDVLNCLNI
jgi:hypothetical protein